LDGSIHLPAQTTPFVGRLDDLREIDARLRNPACRLLTLAGPGGIGKTRLALEAATRLADAYPDRIAFVPLQTLDSPDLIVCAVADAMGPPANQTCDTVEQLLAHLSDRRLLLILDNFEHLLADANIVSDILAAAPRVKVLATSREALNLREEWLWTVGGLPYPAPGALHDANGDSLASYSAVQLFVQSAQRIRPDFSLDDEREGVARICALVDGMPLGIELAAAWVRVLSCADIATEIERNLDFLRTRARNVEERHRDIRGVLDHSWKLLCEAEQDVFKRLAVFRGSFTFDAASHVAGASLATLSALVDKSLVQRDAAGRYELHEMVRQYAERHLNAAMESSVETRDRHSHFYLAFLGQQWGDLLGSRPREALQAIETEIKNVRVAWGWATVMVLEDDLRRGLDSLAFFYDTRGWYQEGEKVLSMGVDAVRAASADPARSPLLARLLARQGMLCSSLTWHDRARALLDESLAISEALGAVDDAAFALERLGEVASFQAKDDEALRHFTASLALFRQAGNRWGEAYALNWLGLLTRDLSRRKALIQASEAIFRELDSRWGAAFVASSKGFVLFSEGDTEAALRTARDGIALCREVGIPWGVAMAYRVIGFIEHARGAYDRASAAYEQASRIALDIRLPRFMAYGAHGLAQALAAQGQIDRAREFYAVACHFTQVPQGTPHDIDLAAELPPDEYDRVVRRAKSLDPVATLKALLAGLAAPATAARDDAPPHGAGELTEREVEILALVAEGLSNRAVAERLILSTGTVKWYLSQVYGKLGVSSRTQAIARAREWGLIP